MEDAGNILLFWFDPSIRWLLQEILPLEGYTVTAIHDSAEALHMIEQNAKPCLILTDNLKVNPAGREALSTLRENEALRMRVRVIGMDIEGVRQMELDWGLDDFIAMPFTAITLLDSIEANFAHLSAQ